MKDQIFKKIKTNPYMQAIRHPEIYLKRMLTHTFLVGIVTFIINWIYINTAMNSIKIPSGIHAMLGFVIAMLLVFRTNTAYERWWEGRKKIQDLKIACSSIISILESSGTNYVYRENFYSLLTSQLDYIRDFLNSEEEMVDYSQLQRMTSLLRSINNCKNIFTEAEYTELRKLLQEITSIIISCERIKHTPIPFAYAIHIKLCIFIYVATLPFSLFNDLNLWSTPVVMALYFIISGTEIISNEIENPFQGEANDLPVNELLNEIKDLVPCK
jgi:putative membrane protein